MKSVLDFVTKRITNVSVIEVVEIITAVGEGTEDDPVRGMVEYWTKDGKLIGKLFCN